MIGMLDSYTGRVATENKRPFNLSVRSVMARSSSKVYGAVDVSDVMASVQV
jgi:hypothetical protein